MQLIYMTECVRCEITWICIMYDAMHQQIYLKIRMFVHMQKQFIRTFTFFNVMDI